jgi:hypothetical protein
MEVGPSETADQLTLPKQGEIGLCDPFGVVDGGSQRIGDRPNGLNQGVDGAGHRGTLANFQKLTKC